MSFLVAEIVCIVTQCEPQLGFYSVCVIGELKVKLRAYVGTVVSSVFERRRCFASSHVRYSTRIQSGVTSFLLFVFSTL